MNFVDGFFPQHGVAGEVEQVICYCIMGRPPHTNQFITIKSLAAAQLVNGRGDDSEKWGRKNRCLDALWVLVAVL